MSRPSEGIPATTPTGILLEYKDNFGQLKQTTSKVLDAFHAAMGFDMNVDPPDLDAGTRVLSWGGQERFALPSAGTLELESGSRERVADTLPADLPIGYHALQFDGSEASHRLILSPSQCALPDARQWGWAVQLYAVRSAASWGFGDFADLRRLARWSADLGAGYLLLNPLGAAAPVVPQDPSPYHSTTRLFHNVCYLCIDEVPGADKAAAELAPLAEQGRALNQQSLIDRDAVFRLKMAALELLWPRQGQSDGLDLHCQEQGETLTHFATYCCLAETWGGDWRLWPREYQRPDSAAVVRFAREQSPRIRFHQWIQFLLDRQLARAAEEIALVRDLPVGFDPGGADAWMWQDMVAHGVSIGAPPDQFNAAGQNWGLPPFVPAKLRAAGYQPFVETIRASLRHARGLRIDHVMGLFRLFWIPDGFAADDGAYVRYPTDDLLAIIALESQRAGAWIAGEDLGTVESNVRSKLADHAILSTKVLWFEDESPVEYPTLAMSAVTTHDLPTIAGLWSGADLASQQRLGLRADVEGYARIRERLIRMTKVSDDAPIDEVIRKIHGLLAEAPSLILAANLPDALAVEPRPNMPGTIDQWPNWSHALPLPLEQVQATSLPRTIADLLSRRAGQIPKSDEDA